MRWFGASPRKATPEGQHLHQLHSNKSAVYINNLLGRGTRNRLIELTSEANSLPESGRNSLTAH
jgi:hypothetical protein